MFNRIRAFFNPEQFQGWGKKRSYFEGWYYKIINASETKAFAVIPGLAIDDGGKKLQNILHMMEINLSQEAVSWIFQLIQTDLERTHWNWIYRM